MISLAFVSTSHPVKLALLRVCSPVDPTPSARRRHHRCSRQPKPRLRSLRVPRPQRRPRQLGINPIHVASKIQYKSGRGTTGAERGVGYRSLKYLHARLGAFPYLCDIRDNHSLQRVGGVKEMQTDTDTYTDTPIHIRTYA